MCTQRMGCLGYNRFAQVLLRQKCSLEVAQKRTRPTCFMKMVKTYYSFEQEL